MAFSQSKIYSGHAACGQINGSEETRVATAPGTVPGAVATGCTGTVPGAVATGSLNKKTRKESYNENSTSCGFIDGNQSRTFDL